MPYGPDRVDGYLQKGTKEPRDGGGSCRCHPHLRSDGWPNRPESFDRPAWEDSVFLCRPPRFPLARWASEVSGHGDYLRGTNGEKLRLRMPPTQLTPRRCRPRLITPSVEHRQKTILIFFSSLLLFMSVSHLDSGIRVGGGRPGPWPRWHCHRKLPEVLPNPTDPIGPIGPIGPISVTLPPDLQRSHQFHRTSRSHQLHAGGIATIPPEVPTDPTNPTDPTEPTNPIGAMSVTLPPDLQRPVPCGGIATAPPEVPPAPCVALQPDLQSPAPCR